MAEALNQQQQEHLIALAKLVRLLNAKRCLTIKEIAERTGCTYAGAARRIDILKERGCRIKKHEPEAAPRRGQFGAKPRRYRLIDNRASRKIVDAARRLA
jgi:DNA-binding MarR family transcriptional regulator